MIVGVPREIKLDEYRVAMLPVGVEELVRRGHSVLVEAGAGLGSGIADHDYLRQGAELVSGPEVEYRLTMPSEGGETEVFFSDLSTAYVDYNASYTS